MVGAHVIANLRHDVLLGVAARDEATLAGDLFGHCCSLLAVRGWDYLGVVLGRTKVQLCGRLVVELDGRRVDGAMPGRQGRVLFAYLAVNRNRTLTRGQLLDALWADGRDGGLAPLLSKLRRTVPLDGLRLALPPGSWVDVEAAADAVHRAESALAQGDCHRAWGPSQVAMFVAGRPFLPDEDAGWVDETRRELESVHLRAMEAYARAGLGIGGTELAAAVRTARELTRREPYRESGYELLMRALAGEGNRAEAVLAYEQLRTHLREDLGLSPSDAAQELHRELLG